MTESTLPVIFLSHGAGPNAVLKSPGKFSAVDMTSPLADFYRTIPSLVEGTVRNILIISAHWEERQFTVGYRETGTPLIFDYGGLQKEAYSPYMTYPVPFDLLLADRVYDLLTTAGLRCNKMERGLDHGAFVPLKACFPEGQIPVVQLSLKANLSVADHIALGEVLAPLRNEGTLIIGAGNATHNLTEFRNGLTEEENRPDERCFQFLEWLRHNIEDSVDYEAMKSEFLQVEQNCPHFDWAHPRTEHFIPLVVSLGSAKPSLVSNTIAPTIRTTEAEKKNHRLYHEVFLGNFGLDSYIFH